MQSSVKPRPPEFILAVEGQFGGGGQFWWWWAVLAVVGQDIFVNYLLVVPPGGHPNRSVNLD